LLGERETVADDRLDGAIEISNFTGDPKWKIYVDASRGRRGIYKAGGRIYGSKTILREEHYNRANGRGE
jgi:hypothetical protein